MKIRILALLMALLALMTLCLVSCKEETDTDEDDDSLTPPNNTIVDPSSVLYDSGVVPAVGVDIKWEIYKDGTLYIKGTGAMPIDLVTSAEGGANSQPWAAYIDGGFIFIKKIVIEEGITGLSQMAFKNCLYLEEVYIKSGVTTIPYECFSGCRSLKKVVAKNVTVLEDCAFDGCSRLEKITLSASLSEVCDGAFTNACKNNAASGVLSLSLAGTEEEWNTAKETLTVGLPDSSNKVFADAMAAPTFVSK